MCRSIGAIVLLIATASMASGSQSVREGFLSWSAQHAETIGRLTHKRGRVGGFWDTRLLKTERAYNYKLAGTWLTPETIRATARLNQLRSRVSDEDTLQLVKEAEAAGDTVIMIEIDPREGSGVIPTEWEAFLQPKNKESQAVRGQIASKLRDVRALSGVVQRNYDYDRFWAVFPLTGADGSPLFSDDDIIAELVVRIYSKEGRIEWTVPLSLRHKTRSLGI
jgi:hypothetical protein